MNAAAENEKKSPEDHDQEDSPLKASELYYIFKLWGVGQKLYPVSNFRFPFCVPDGPLYLL